MKAPPTYQNIYLTGSTTQQLQGQSGLGMDPMTKNRTLQEGGNVFYHGLSNDLRTPKIKEEDVFDEEEELASFKRFKRVEEGPIASQMGPPGKFGASVSLPMGRHPVLSVKQNGLHQLHGGSKQMPTVEAFVQANPINPLDEPSPLGLSLRKSPSLLDLIQRKLGQNDSMVSCTDAMAQELMRNRNGNCSALSIVDKDKLKAANFPACFLKIGTWERASRYEGDLVAKCYYAKRKLVWEVLDSGLKSKIEIQWSDITALKATLPENQPGSLDIEISRPPLFFKETNPQPRKHTLWQSTSDFTEGQAPICRRHFLQFPEGVLNRHFEKLMQCDTRLKGLSEEGHDITDSLFFDPQRMTIDKQENLHYQSILSDQNVHSMLFEGLKTEPLPHLGPGHGMIDSFVGHHLEVAPVLGTQGSERTLEIQTCGAASPSSVMDSRGMDESSGSETEDMILKDDVPVHIHDEQVFATVAAAHLSMKNLGKGGSYQTPITGSIGSMKQNISKNGEWLSISPPDTLTNWRQDHMTRDRASGIMRASEKQALDEIALHLLGEPLSTESNAYAMGQVDVLSSALAQEVCQTMRPVPFLDSCEGHSQLQGQGKKYHSGHLDIEKDIKIQQRLDDNYWNSSRDGLTNTFDTGATVLTSHGSSGDLLYLPRIASLPQFFEPAPHGPFPK